MSVIGDFILLNRNSTSICEQEYQNYPSGAEAYSKFIKSFGSTPAYYSLFPKKVVTEWSKFVALHPVPFAYTDWLLHLLAFYSDRVCHPGRGAMLGHYNLENWGGSAVSENSNLKIALKSGVPESCAPLMNLFWLLDAIDLLSHTMIGRHNQFNEFSTILARDQINRFIGNLEYRIKLIHKINDKEYLVHFKKLIEAIDATELNMDSLRTAMYDFVNAAEGHIPTALNRYFRDQAHL